MERWKARLNIAADAPEPEHPAGGEREASAAEPQAAEQQAEEEAADGEYRFLGQQEQQQAGDAQALAPATEEQAAAQQQAAGDEDERDGADADVAAAAEEEEAGGEEPMDADQPTADQQQQQLVTGTANWGAGGDRKAGLQTADAAEQPAEEQAAEPGEEEGEEGGGSEEAAAVDEGAAADESYVAARLQAASLEDGLPLTEQLLLAGLSEEAAAELRRQLDARLRAASEGSAPLPDAAAEVHGREVWTRCEALTAGGQAEAAWMVAEHASSCGCLHLPQFQWLVPCCQTLSPPHLSWPADLPLPALPPACPQAWWASWRSSCA